MPTLWSQTLIPTSRQDPADAEVPSHRLMLRAGLIRQLGSGLYTYLPAGWRALRKTIEIVREEMNRAGAQELLMPALEPMELFADTKRDEEYGENLFRLEDRHGRNVALAPTHEEILTEAMSAYVESYRQLPLNLYQIQTKFRDEFRPRFGVLRSREFIMKDAYSFHLTVDGDGGLNETYDRMYDAYCRIFDRCGLKYEVVDAESGPIGGSASHEFMVLCDTGEDTILKSDKGNYAANVEKCGIGERDLSVEFFGEPTSDLREVSTPDTTTITDLCKQWPKFAGGGKLKPQNVLKTLVYRVEGDLTAEEKKKVIELETLGIDDDGFYFYWIVVVRGDHEVNEGKVKAAVEGVHGREMNFTPTSVGLHLMDEAEAKEAGFEVGFVGPHAYHSLPTESQMRTRVLVDHEATQPGFWVAGANKVDHHVMHFNWQRECDRKCLGDHVADDHRTHVADIRNAADGDPSPHNDGGVLRESKGIEVGHVFKLGAKYSDAMGFRVSDEQQQQRSVIMGCYGIGVGRIVAGAIETSHDDDGIVWPASIAPYSVHITPIKYEGELCKTCHDLAAKLEAAGLDVLIDDRDERPGPKFKDADLLGCPIRLTVGDKALAQDAVEFKRRDDRQTKGELVKLSEVVDRCVELIAGGMPTV